MASSHLEELYRRMHAVIRKIPRGRVATYGQVAELAGLPGGARIAAASLKVSRKADALPWQRVIGKAGPKRGRIKILDPVGAAIQRALLEKERVEVGDRGIVDLVRYGWLSSHSPLATRAGPKGESARGASLRQRPRSGSKRRASSSRR
jgi:methylated-DNA-protein-cysteine methyltransferase-like protein